MNQAMLCSAIQQRKLVQFFYNDDAPGIRTVEPHMVAYNQKGHLALSAWYRYGASESNEGQGWREYLLADITRVTILDATFSGPRPGYKPTGGKSFRNVQCALKSRRSYPG